MIYFNTVSKRFASQAKGADYKLRTSFHIPALLGWNISQYQSRLMNFDAR